MIPPAMPTFKHLFITVFYIPRSIPPRRIQDQCMGNNRTSMDTPLNEREKAIRRKMELRSSFLVHAEAATHRLAA